MSKKISLEEATMKALLGELEPEEKDDVEGIVDGVMVITDPDVTPKEYEEVIERAQEIIEDTPEGEVPFTDEYIGEYIMTCPICGSNFIRKEILNVGDSCPICDQVPEAGFVLVGQIATQEDVELQNDIKSDEENTEDTDVNDDLYGEEIPLEEPIEGEEDEEQLVASEQQKTANNKLEESDKMNIVKRPEQLNEQKVKTMADWKTDISTDFQVGDLVADDIIQELRNSLPPVTDRKDVFQEGEPYSHNANGATYLTFTRVDKDTWRYEGPKNKITNYSEEKEMKTESIDKDYDEMLELIYKDYKDQGMSKEFWSDLLNYIDDFDGVDRWYEASYPSNEEEWNDLDESKEVCPECGEDPCICEDKEKKEEVVPRVPGSVLKSKEEEYSFEDIVAQMEIAETYDDLYEAATHIQDNRLKEEVDNMLAECEEDGDEVEVAYSIVTTDLLDPLVMNGDKNI